MFTVPPLLIYMTAEPFEYPRKRWRENMILVGPCAWEPSANPPAWLGQIDQPIVLITTSSEFQDDGRLVQVALEALAEEQVSVVATLPPVILAASKCPLTRMSIVSFPTACYSTEPPALSPMAAWEPRQKALAARVPVCVVPFGRDQLEVARRVEVAGAGTRLPARRLRPDRLRQKVHEAMARTDGARRTAAAFRAAGGPVAAADAIEQRLLDQAPLSASAVNSN